MTALRHAFADSDVDTIFFLSDGHPSVGEETHPDRILALTFSRKAAEQLRDRVAARVGVTMSASIGSTFHSFAYGLVRRYAPAELYLGPLRLL